MPTSVSRKQRYVLDVDDLVRQGFMSQENADALLHGLNASATAALDTAHGGTNNVTAAFVDQQLLKYDATTRKIVSAGITGVIPGGYTVFIPRETQTVYTVGAVNNSEISVDAIPMVLASTQLVLPVNAQWSDVLVWFQFRLTQTALSMGGLRLTIGPDNEELTTLVQPSSTRIYTAGATPDEQWVTWVSMGQIPDSYALDTDLQLKLWGAASDVPEARSAGFRISYRGLQPAPDSSLQKGLPVFLNTPISVYAGNGSMIDWVQFELPTSIPATASALILVSKMASYSSNTSGTMYYRRYAGNYEYTIGRAVSSNGSDHDSSITQWTLPFHTASSYRSFQYKVGGAVNEGAYLHIIGYIT
jgi:hypothetical protein